MEAGREDQRMLNPLGEKLVGDLVIAKNSWTQRLILSSMETGNLDVMRLIIGSERTHTDSFPPKSNLDLSL